jgi:hypothetical protein
MDNLDQIEEYLHYHHSDFVGYTSDSMENTLLLDSCSTVNLIANKDLLHGIHKVPTTMRIQCNAGVTTTNLKGWLGDFPEPVWYNPDGVANIMSLFVIKKYYRVRYDSNRQDALLVTQPNGDTMVFKPTEKGL